MIRDVVFLLLFPSSLHPLLSTNKMHFQAFSRVTTPSEGEIDGFVIAWSSELENILQLEKTKFDAVELDNLENDDITEEETKRAEVDAASCNPKLPKHMATWADSNRPGLNRTENFVRFQGPRAERSDGFSRKCAILFRTSHPAAARFRRSFRISVCKTSLF